MHSLKFRSKHYSFSIVHGMKAVCGDRYFCQLVKIAVDLAKEIVSKMLATSLDIRRCVAIF